MCRWRSVAQNVIQSQYIKYIYHFKGKLDVKTLTNICSLKIETTCLLSIQCSISRELNYSDAPRLCSQTCILILQKQSGLKIQNDKYNFNTFGKQEYLQRDNSSMKKINSFCSRSSKKRSLFKFCVRLDQHRGVNNPDWTVMQLRAVCTHVSCTPDFSFSFSFFFSLWRAIA